MHLRFSCTLHTLILKLKRKKKCWFFRVLVKTSKSKLVQSSELCTKILLCNCTVWCGFFFSLERCFFFGTYIVFFSMCVFFSELIVLISNFYNFSAPIYLFWFKYLVMICIPFCGHFKTGSQYIQLNYLTNNI